MHNSNTETKNKYKIEDLPKLFKEKSKNISKAFSSETIKISAIRSRSIESNIQKFSFELTATDKDTFNIRLFRINPLIDFFKICLPQEKNFTVNMKVPKESSELYNNHCKTNSYKTVEEFINNAPSQILLQGVTITLQTDAKDINLDNLHQIELFLNEKLQHAEKTENQDKKEQSETNQKNAQNRQIVPVTGLFSYNLTSSKKQVMRVPIVVAAMRDNFFWFGSSFRLPNFFNTIQFFFQQPPKLSIRNQRALTYHPTLQEAKQDKVTQKDGIDERRIEDVTTLISDFGQTTSHTEYFKANRKKKSKKQTKELSEKEKQLAIKQARNDARVAMIDNQIEHRGKKLDEIFIEVINGYKDQDPETFRNVFNSIFNIIYFQDKQLHEILEPGEITEVLQILERPQPLNNSLLGKEYLQKQVYRKKEQLVSSVYIQQPPTQHKNTPHKSTNPLPIKDPSPATNEAKTLPPTNIALKSPLKTVFSSKKAYFCLFIIVASASTLCLWHFPSGKVSMLKGLVPPEKRESIGLALNIGLPILTALCVLSLAYFIYSEYSIESIKQVSENDPLSRTYS
ncbi:hypothetical protein [Wolbachia endosymbiont (group A) of Gymnosoma rotundatum]|uniref:hypothetical protein n=1 Tax=Wolbachia endosymbiont (group A) of Gymnosoma rotundatum TaxID=2954016 RepID=UPI0022267D64|nr:hypothetical protein [Wolbachia endosymbiont (group A) of Gymnosoma rotundatum]